jgi:hypothetical protein
MKVSVYIDRYIGAEIFPTFATSRRFYGNRHAAISATPLTVCAVRPGLPWSNQGTIQMDGSNELGFEGG